MRVDWVHPTWRDLVIGTLVDDAEARRHFLARCGAYGAVLALSTEGGVAGERRLPLIAGDEDWDVLADRLYSLVAELEPGELIATLTALAATVEDLDEATVAREARALSETVLRRTAAGWDAARQPIELGPLDAWLTLARLLKPRPAPPSLSVSWAELLPARGPALTNRAAVELFADWLTLCMLLWSYDRALLDELGFGTDQVSLMIAFTIEVDRKRASIPPELTDLIIRALDSIASLLPETAALPRRVSHRLLSSDVEQSQTWAATAAPGWQALDLVQFDVDRVLADL